MLRTFHALHLIHCVYHTKMQTTVTIVTHNRQTYFSSCFPYDPYNHEYHKHLLCGVLRRLPVCLCLTGHALTVPVLLPCLAVPV